MYSNRQGSKLFITEETNGKALILPLTQGPLEHVLLSFTDFRFSNVLNNITTLNNRLKITHNIAGVLDIYIPIKFYNAVELRDKLNVMLSPHITVTYADYQFTFVSTSLFSIDSETTCRKILGLGKILPLNATLYPAYTLIPPNKSNMIATNYITLKLETISVHMLEPSKNSDNTFIRIPVNCQYGESIFYRPSIVHQFLLRKPKLRTFIITLHDDLGNTLENDFSASFDIEYVYVPPSQEIHEDADENKDDLPFTHFDGNIKIKAFINKSGFTI